MNPEYLLITAPGIQPDRQPRHLQLTLQGAVPGGNRQSEGFGIIDPPNGHMLIFIIVPGVSFCHSSSRPLGIKPAPRQ